MAPLQLEYPINKVYNLRPFKDLASEFLEFVMNGVIIDVVIPVLRAFKFYDKCVRDAILQNKISTYPENLRSISTGKSLGKTEHTWSPSGELSEPPDADLIYGFLEVG